MEPGELTAAGTRTAVGITGASYTWAGLPLSDWVALFTILYLALQTIVLMPKVWAVIKKLFKREKHDG